MTAPRRSPTCCTRAECSENTPRTQPNLSPTEIPAPGATSRSTPMRGTRSCTSPGFASTPSKTPPTTPGRTRVSPARSGASLTRSPAGPPGPFGTHRAYEPRDDETTDPRLPAARRRRAGGMHEPRRAEHHQEHGIELPAEPRRTGGSAAAIPERTGTGRRAADADEGPHGVCRALRQLDLPHAQRRSAHARRDLRGGGAPVPIRR